MPFAQDILTRVVNVHWRKKQIFGANFSLGFLATPTGFYKDGTPTVVTLSVVGLPLLDPYTFMVNLPEGVLVPPFFEHAYYGGSTYLTMPDGEFGTLTADWNLGQLRDTGTAHGGVNYETSKTGSGPYSPFFGANKIQIKVVMQLRPLDFLSIASADNHYEWHGFALANVPGLPSTEDDPMSKSGRAETGAVLTFVLDVVMDPPSAQFTVGTG